MANKLKLLAAALATSGLLVACGGGGGADTTPKASVTSVKVVGDSLSDSGTFGFKFTVQNPAARTGTGSTQVWTEYVAGSYGSTLCAHYSAASEAGLATATVNATCNNYAVGGAVIDYAAATLTPHSIVKQLQDLGASGLTSNDMVVVDGGANDTAALISAALTAGLTGSATALTTQVGPLLGSSTLLKLQTDAGGDNNTFVALVGVAYMKALAQKLVTAVNANVLDKGVSRVLVLNLPKLTLTPRINVTLSRVEASITKSAGATAGQAAAAKYRTLIDTWVQAFNQQLETSWGSEGRVGIIDFYNGLADQVANPAQYGYTDVATPACPAVGVDSTALQLPVYSLPTCTTSTLLTKNPQANWWDGYSFADDQHPTPYGHKQMSQLASRVLARKNWL